VRRAIATILLVACTAALVTACGQKGPLRLPDKNATVVTTPPATSTTSAPTAPTSTPATSPAAAPPDKSKDKSDNTQPPQ
jgi:predicted small lipoprotein YifL